MNVVWKPAIIVACVSAPFVVLLKDRWPWIVAVPIIVGVCWILYREMSKDDDN